MHKKVAAAGAAAAITSILAFVLHEAGIDLPVEVQGSVTTLLVYVAGYLTPA